MAKEGMRRSGLFKLTRREVKFTPLLSVTITLPASDKSLRGVSVTPLKNVHYRDYLSNQVCQIPPPYVSTPTYITFCHEFRHIYEDIGVTRT